jgi:hypothetical protein
MSGIGIVGVGAREVEREEEVEGAMVDEEEEDE